MGISTQSRSAVFWVERLVRPGSQGLAAGNLAFVDGVRIPVEF
jgi:hypothetical protein